MLRRSTDAHAAFRKRATGQGFRVGVESDLRNHPKMRGRVDDFDAEPLWINTASGVFDVATRRLMPHSPGLMQSRIAPHPFDPSEIDATIRTVPTVWQDLLDRTFSRNREPIAYVQRLIGYAALGPTTERVLAAFYGSGANGKSTVMRAFSDVLGGYAAAGRLGLLEARRDGPPMDALANLAGVRLLSLDETDERSVLASGLVKAITSREASLTGRRLYGNEFTFRCQTTTILATNHLPRADATDEAIWARLRCIPFRNVVPLAERDQQLGEKLRAVIPGILTWIIQGACDWHRDGLGTCPAVDDATGEWRRSSAPIGQFLADACEPCETCGLTIEEMYEVFRRFLQRRGEVNTFSLRTFQFALNSREDLVQRRTKGARLISGLRFRSGSPSSPASLSDAAALEARNN